MDRKQFLAIAVRGVGTLAPGLVASLLGGDEPTPILGRVGTTESAQIRTAGRIFQSWDLSHGGVLVRETALAQVRWSADILVVLTEQALVSTDRLTGTKRAKLHTARSRALATMLRFRETLIAGQHRRWPPSSLHPG